jgi:hypothetical protein
VDDGEEAGGRCDGLEMPRSDVHVAELTCPYAYRMARRSWPSHGKIEARGGMDYEGGQPARVHAVDDIDEHPPVAMPSDPLTPAST